MNTILPKYNNLCNAMQSFWETLYLKIQIQAQGVLDFDAGAYGAGAYGAGAYGEKVTSMTGLRIQKYLPGPIQNVIFTIFHDEFQ